MNRHELNTILKSMNFRPGKLLGQNFMVDRNFLDFIIRTADPKVGERILEVGPGFGALTRELLSKGANVTAVEYDRRICEYLRKNLLDSSFSLVEADAARIDVEELMGATSDFRCIANLPYSISSVFIATLVKLANPPLDMLFLLQKEMGLRIAGGVNTKNYGSLSVRVQVVYDVEIVRRVPPQVFYPSPDVDSALVRFIRKPNFPDCDLRNIMDSFVKAAFSQRRKKMIKAVSKVFGRERVEAIFSSLGISCDCRAESLDPELFLEIARMLRV